MAKLRKDEKFKKQERQHIAKLKRKMKNSMKRNEIK